MKKRYFPCWVCKGSGGEQEIVTDEGQGPYYECGYCDGEGMIEIGGKIHRRIRAEKIAMDILSFNNPNFECSHEYLLALGEKALKLV